MLSELPRFNFMTRRLICAAVLGAGVLFAAAPALAGDTGCLWDRMPKKETRAAIDAGLAGGPDAMQEKLVFADVRAAAAACGLDASDEESSDLSNAAYGVALQKLGEAWFETNLKIAPDKLDRAWDHLGEDAQAVVKRAMHDRSRDTDSVDGVVEAFTRLLETAPPADQAEADKRQTFTGAYISGRALRAAYEPKL